MNIWELCKCGGSGICPFCKILCIAAVIAAAGAAGFLLGRRQKKDKDV